MEITVRQWTEDMSLFVAEMSAGQVEGNSVKIEHCETILKVNFQDENHQGLTIYIPYWGDNVEQAIFWYDEWNDVTFILNSSFLEIKKLLCIGNEFYVDGADFILGCEQSSTNSFEGWPKNPNKPNLSIYDEQSNTMIATVYVYSGVVMVYSFKNNVTYIIEGNYNGNVKNFTRELNS